MVEKIILKSFLYKLPVPVAARCTAYVCGSSSAEIVGSNPARGMSVCLSVCCDRCVFSGRGMCDGLISRLEEFYRICCVVVCGR